jgi:prevent-host-death family protein
MKTLSIREARAALGHLDELLEASGDLILTRHGRPIARILPIAGRRPVPSHRDLRAATAALPEGSEVLLRQERDDR